VVTMTVAAKITC